MAERRSKLLSSSGSAPPVAHLAGQVVARQHHVGNAVHQLVDERQRQPNGARRALAADAGAGIDLVGRYGETGGNQSGLVVAGAAVGQRIEQGVVIGFGDAGLLAIADIAGELADSVHDREDGGDGRRIGGALTLADEREHFLGGMGEALETRQVEEAAAALHGVEEAEESVEARTVGRVGFPRDHFAGEHLQRFQCLSDEFSENLVHVATCRGTECHSSAMAS